MRVSESPQPLLTPHTATFSTQKAGKPPRVDALVFGEAAGSRECLATHSAHVWLFTRVDALVSGEVTGSRE